MNKSIEGMMSSKQKYGREELIKRDNDDVTDDEKFGLDNKLLLTPLTVISIDCQYFDDGAEW